MYSCRQNATTNDEGIGYTEYINSKQLEKVVISKYPSGQEKAVVFIDKADAEKQVVKEMHFFENGNLQVEGTLKNAKRHGIWTFYHDNGNIWSTGRFENGKSVGVFHIYDKEGQIKYKYHYRNDSIVKEEYFVKGKLYKTVDS